MTEKTGLEPKRKVPGRDSNPSEWDGNNRIYNLGKKYEKSFETLTEGQPAENVKLYSDFLRRTKFEGISLVRQINYMRALKRLKAITKDLPLKELSKSHTDEYLAQISDSSPGTKQILFYCLKKFLVFLGKESYLEGVKPAPVRNLKVSAADLLTREVARIQSFPDSFKLAGTDSQQYKALGNAIPPVMMWHITREVLKQLKKQNAL